MKKTALINLKIFFILFYRPHLLVHDDVLQDFEGLNTGLETNILEKSMYIVLCFAFNKKKKKPITYFIPIYIISNGNNSITKKSRPLNDSSKIQNSPLDLYLVLSKFKTVPWIFILGTDEKLL